MVKGRPVLLAGLDIGTSKTVVALAEPGGRLPRLLGFGESPSVGLRKGIVFDPELASKSITQALIKAEAVTGTKPGSVYISFNGVGINVRDCRLLLPSHSYTFLYNSCFNSKHDIAAEGILPDEKILQFIPAGPGILGLKQQTKVRAVTTTSRNIQNLVESARLAGLKTKGIFYGPLAAAEALLTPAERELGTVLVDIGAAATSVSLFNRGLMRETTVLAIGGEHLSGDLAIGLRTSLELAEKILKKYSLLSEWNVCDKQELTGFFDTIEGGKASAGLIKLIIEARVHELIQIISETIRGFGFYGQLPGGAVLCGGVSRLKGLAELAEEKLQMPVRTGQAETGGSLIQPGYFNAFGLVRYGYSHLYGEGRVSKKKKK